jgi:putative inorganic carbon (HCO3(-)) transporter
VQLVSLLSCGALVYLTCILVDTPERAERVVLAILTLAAIWSVGAFLEKQGLMHFGPVIRTFASGIRAKVTFKDPNIFGNFLAVSAVLALPLVPIAGSTTRRIALLCGVGLSFMAILFSASRGALAGLMVGVLVMMLALRIPAWQKLLIIVMVAVVLIGGVVAVMSPTWIQEKVVGVAQDRSSANRVGIVGSSIEMARDNVFGVGAGNFPLVYPFYRNQVVRFNLVESHTMLATLLVEYGVLGLLLFLWILWRFVTRVSLVAWREERGLLQALATGVLAAGAAVLAQSFVYSLETSKYLWLTIGLGMAVYTMWRTKTQKENS